jgi:hypothetical protein
MAQHNYLGARPEKDRVLKNDRQHSNCRGMMVRLLRSLLAVMIATVLVFAPAAQGTIAMPCDTPAVASVTNHQQPPSHTPGTTPCKEKMSGCFDMSDCGLSASLNVRGAVAAGQPVWTAVAYWPVTDSRAGLFIEPDLGPPITI